jgi:hypothetical protein
MQIFALYASCIVLLFMHGQCNIFCSLIGPQVQGGMCCIMTLKQWGEGQLAMDHRHYPHIYARMSQQLSIKGNSPLMEPLS